MIRRPHTKSESVVVATRRNQTSRQGTLRLGLRFLAYPEAKKHPDSCRRRAKLHMSQGPTLFYPCDRPILVLSDVGILACEDGAGLICVILG